MTGGRRPGRPRSETARRAVLVAAIGELEDRGYSALTMQGIAVRAGVGKQTIYRWWSSRADVVLDALVDVVASRISVPDNGTLRDDLLSFLSDTFRQRGRRPVLVGLMAEALLDPVFAREFRDRFLFRRRAALRTILERAVERGEIVPDTDLEMVIDIVYGVLWYRMMLDHAPLSMEAGRQLTELVLRAIT
jgi:AcrR family transcriptional regulator